MKRCQNDDLVALAILAGGLLAWTVLFGVAWEACQ